MHHRLDCRLLSLVLAVVVAAASMARAQVGADPVTVTAQWSDSHARAGDQRVLAIVIDMAGRWHINPDAARTGDGLIATSIEVAGHDPRLRIGPVQFPQPAQVTVNYTGAPISIPVYEERAVFYIPVIVANDAEPGEAALSLSVRYQTCNDRLCLAPTTRALDMPLTVGEATMAGAAPADAALFADFDRSIFPAMVEGAVSTVGPVSFDVFGHRFTIDPSGYGGWITLLAVAAAGGLLLNFTPCVLPIIPIKIMGLAQVAGNRGRCLVLGLAMGAGVVAFWMALGAAIALVAGFDAINELFQHVWFPIGVGVIIAIMAAGMGGFFTFQPPRALYAISPRQDTLAGSTGLGVMTAILSTPCTAPLMGAAAAWAITQSPRTSLAAFAAIGGGMALPYVVLAAFPALAQRMPRTGPAGELIKQVMGLLMLAAAAYFIGVGVTTALATPPQPPSSIYWWPVAGFIALAGAHLAWRTWRTTSRPMPRAMFVTVGVGAVVLAALGAWRLTAPSPIEWVHYTPRQFARHLERGNVIVLEFTAEWCLNCKTLEHGVLFSDQVVALFEDPAVVPMKVDITSAANVAGAAKLAQVGRVAIPLLVIYAPDGREIFKSDYYTADQIVAAVHQAQSQAQPRTPTPSGGGSRAGAASHR